MSRVSRLLAVFLLAITAAAQSAQQAFRITPLRPVEELRAEARRATPPEEQGDFRSSELVEIAKLDPTIKLEIRYATEQNFMGAPMYSQARAFLQRPAAEAVLRVHRKLKEEGFGLLIHDGYRPWYVTKMFWEATPLAQRTFVADPERGSRHNRGCAVDLTLYDLKNGKAVTMPSEYDEFSDRAYADYAGGTDEQRRLRAILRAAMEAAGFQQNPTEWWHYDYKDWRLYRIENIRFEDIR